MVITGFKLFNKNVPVKDALNPDSPLEELITYTNDITLKYDESVFTFEYATLNYTIPIKKQYAYILEGFDKGWNEVGTKRSATFTNLDPGNYVFKVKGWDNEGEWSENMAAIKITITPPFWQTLWFKILTVSGLAGLVFSLVKARISIIKKQKADLEKQVEERTAELVLQKEKIIAQSEMLEELYNDVKDSIRAAQNIQEGILPTEEYIRMHLPQSFILNKPKDVVSGDFYWFDEVNGQLVLALADCTGHGVSGAFMSINGHHLLNKSIWGSERLVASQILNRLNKSLISELHMEEGEVKIIEGMDIALCIFDNNCASLQFAGANQRIYLIRNGELTQIKGNRYAIGLSVYGKKVEFSNNEVSLQKGDVIYMFSDGYADQLGGEDGQSKFMYPRFRNLLLSIHQQNMEQQKIILDKELNNWKGTAAQLDDIMIIGIRI